MKKIIILLILFTGIITAQVQSSISRWNSTAQELDSAGVYTGTAEVVTPYTSISITIRADSSGSYLVLFGNGSTLTNATAYKIYTMTYTAGDTAHTRTFPVAAPYFKIVYTTTATDTSNLYLATMLHRDAVVPQTMNARVDVDVSSSALPSGAATSANQTNGSQRSLMVDGSNAIIGVATSPIYTKPDYAYVRSVDTWGAASDTSVYDFGNNYLKGYVTVYDSSATADTLVFEVYSHAKLGYTTQMIGFRDVVTDYLEINNSTVIIAGTTAKKFEINELRPGIIRVRPKTTAGRSAIKTKRVIFEGVN